MAGKARSDNFKSPECRLSYAKGLWKPRKISETSTREAYGCTLIFPVSARPALEKIAAEVITTEWGDKGLERAKQGLIHAPFIAGDGPQARNKETGEIKTGLGPDVFFIRPTAGIEYPPQVRWRDPNLQMTENEVYSGCYGKAVLNIFSWHNSQQGDGVSFGIAMFQKLREGEKLGGGGIEPDKWMEEVPDEGPATATEGGRGASGLFG